MNRRSYKSSVRAAQAAQTRSQIRHAAWECFGEVGFEAATVAQIARRAGVSVATVFSTFESKAGIVASMLEEMEAEVDLADRTAAIMEETEPQRQMRAFVALHTDLFENSRGVLRAALDARQRPEVAAMMAEGDRHRRGAVEGLARHWDRLGALRAGLGRRRAAETMWLASSVETYLSSVEVLGWSGLTYRRWLAGLFEREILA